MDEIEIFANDALLVCAVGASREDTWFQHNLKTVLHISSIKGAKFNILLIAGDHGVCHGGNWRLGSHVQIQCHSRQPNGEATSIFTSKDIDVLRRGCKS